MTHCQNGPTYRGGTSPHSHAGLSQLPVLPLPRLVLRAISLSVVLANAYMEHLEESVISSLAVGLPGDRVVATLMARGNENVQFRLINPVKTTDSDRH